MIRPQSTVRASQGPRFALKEMRRHGLDRLIVLSDEGRRPIGLVTVDSIRQAIDRPNQTLADIADASLLNHVAPDSSLDELISLTVNESTPLTVIDEKERLLGVIVRSTILGALNTGREEV